MKQDFRLKQLNKNGGLTTGTANQIPLIQSKTTSTIQYQSPQFISKQVNLCRTNQNKQIKTNKEFNKINQREIPAYCYYVVNAGSVLKFIINIPYVFIKIAYFSQQKKVFICKQSRGGWIILQAMHQLLHQRQLHIKQTQPFSIVTNNCNHIVLFNSSQIYLIQIFKIEVKRVPLLLQRNQKVQKVYYKHDSLIILLNSGELIGWGNNYQGQIGLLLQTFYQQPEVIKSQELPIRNIQFVSFLEKQTLLLSLKEGLFTCQSNNKFKLNFQGFKQVFGFDKQKPFEVLLQYFHLQNNYKSLDLDNITIELLSEDLMIFRAQSQFRAINLKNKSMLSMNDYVSQQWWINNEAAVLVIKYENDVNVQCSIKQVQQFLYEETNKIQDYKHINLIQQNKCDIIQDLKNKSGQQKIIIELQDQLIRKLQQQIQMSQLKEQNILPKKQKNYDQQLMNTITAFSKISKLRRLLQNMQI